MQNIKLLGVERQVCFMEELVRFKGRIQVIICKVRPSL